MNIFERIIYELQYKIQCPKSYGLFHIICILIAVGVLIYLVRKKKNEKTLKRILCIYGFGALILEILKQIIISFEYDSGVVTWEYPWHSFPFQLCTTPIFISLLYLVLKNDEIKEKMLSYFAFVTILGSIATAVYPEDCFVRMLLVDIHTMYLHLGSLVVSLYLLITHRVDIKFKNVIYGYCIFIMFASAAEFMNVIVYNSGVLVDETFNMFYISPYFISALPIISKIQESVPFICFLIIYLGLVFIGSTIVYLITKLIMNHRHRKSVI